MRTFPAAIAAAIAGRKPLVTRVGLWFQPRNRATGAVETLGLWTGEYDQAFTVEGASRFYLGAGAVLDMPEMTASVGLDVRTYRARLSLLAEGGQQLVRGYDCRLARCEVHQFFFDPGAPHTLLGAPVRKFKGWVDDVQVPDDPLGGAMVAEMTMASASRGLTIPLEVFRSDESYKAQRSGDRIGRYASIAGAVDVNWGTARNA